MGKWVGWQIPSRDLNAWICPVYHPSFVLREVKSQKAGTPIEKLFRDHLKAAVNLEGKPYKKKPKDLLKKITILMEDEAVARRLDSYRLSEAPIAFDYETSMLKSESKEGDIASVAVCWAGKETIAFPWRGILTKKAFIALMKAKNPKIGHSAKYEDRWSSRIDPSLVRGIDTGIQNWVWCTQANSHVWDNRKGIHDLEFVGMVMIGQKPWSSHISPLLRAKGSYQLNRIKDIGIRDLLLYNGMDALVTYKVAQVQMKLLGKKL
jgi:hypothetical protein